MSCLESRTMGVLTEVAALFEPSSPNRATAFSALFFFCSVIGYFLFVQPHYQQVKLPFGGVKSTNFVSLFLGRCKFITNAGGMIDDGYKMVGSSFRFSSRVARHSLAVVFTNRSITAMHSRFQHSPTTVLSCHRSISRSSGIFQTRR